MLDFWGVAKKKLATLPFPLQEMTNFLKIGHPKRNLVLKPSIFRCEMMRNVSFREGKLPPLKTTTWVSQNLEVWSRDDEEPRRKGNRLSNKGAIELPRLRVFLGVCYFGLAAVSFKEGNIYLVGGGFRYFLEFSPPKNWGNDPIWLAHIFPNGLVQPPTIRVFFATQKTDSGSSDLDFRFSWFLLMQPNNYVQHWGIVFFSMVFDRLKQCVKDIVPKTRIFSNSI